MPLSEAWFETEGKRHLREFFGQIERAVQRGKSAGLKTKRFDAGDLIRIYRGDEVLLSEQQLQYIKRLFAQGWKVTEVAAHMGVEYNTIYSLYRTWRRKHALNKSRSGSIRAASE